MKNMKKFAAGFIAAAMAMTMSLSAFAEVVAPSISEDKATLNIGTGITTVNGDQTTMMAYVVPGIITDTKLAPDYTGAEGQEIVALDQVDGETGIASVPVDPAKLVDGNTIVVKISGTDGNLATYLITMEASVTTYSVTYELNDGTVTNPGASTFDADDTIAAFIGALEAPAKVDLTGAYTYEFSHWALTAEGADVTTLEGKTNMVDLLEGEATSITLYAVYTATPVQQETEDVLIADVNGDGTVNVSDMNAMIAYIKNNLSHSTYSIGVAITGSTTLLGDVTGDGSTNVSDMNAYIAYVKNNLSHSSIDFAATVAVPK